MNSSNKHVHFIGIGGVGMAGIAEVLITKGYNVSGSDLKSSNLTNHLKDLSAKIFIGHQADNIPQETTIVVYSSAVTFDNVEFLEAKKRQLLIISRAEMLAEVMRMKFGIVVAGSHGKTTTTSMTGKILQHCGLDPTIIVGGRILSQNSGASIGTGDYIVAESDESDGSFCLLKPRIAIVTNIDREHLSFYGSFGELEKAFLKFMQAVPFDGLIVACFDDPVVATLARKSNRRVLSYGFSPQADLYASEIELKAPANKYSLNFKGQKIGEISLPLIGKHMISNSLAAIAVALELGIEIKDIKQALATFPGVARRCELVSHTADILVLDDYAHHPTEIQATLLGISKSWKKSANSENDRGRLIVVFQPHRYTRTRDLFSEFITCFNDADLVIISDIYAASEPEIPGISAEKLALALQHPAVQYIPKIEDIPAKLLSIIKPNDIVVSMGAGNIWQVSRELAKALSVSGIKNVATN